MVVQTEMTVTRKENKDLATRLNNCEEPLHSSDNSEASHNRHYRRRGGGRQHFKYDCGDKDYDREIE